MAVFKENLEGVQETLLIPLYIRASESRRPDAIIKDDYAVKLSESLKPHLKRISRIKLDENDKLFILLRNLEFDRLTSALLKEHRNAVVFHIGCGLDTRFERTDNGFVEWYDMDLPDVIELRRTLINNNNPRYHLVPGSVFDFNWAKTMGSNFGKPVLLLAEGVFMYFEEKEIRSLLHKLKIEMQGAEIIFDALLPFIISANNLKLKLSKKTDTKYGWGLKNGSEIEKWEEGIRLLSEWYPFDENIPRLKKIKWMGRIPLFKRIMGVYRYRLGS